jgi:alkanesulfonate monooxygenase SsuD/methylene tetrahydromethanopterin reductase-like flavin-dependent oxidoreductase (luciferase family)
MPRLRKCRPRGSPEDLALVDDHDERIEHEREVIRLLKELWTHPAPNRVTFEGKFVRCTDLPFNPAPLQQPHPPIWIGGDSDATLGLVKELADGWVMLTSGNPETLQRVLSAPDWPARPMTLVRNAWVFVAETESAAVAEASREFSTGALRVRGTLDEFLKTQIIGTPAQCLQRLQQFESWGINYVRINFATTQHQEEAARLLLPLVVDGGA